MFGDTWCDRRSKECRTILPVGFNVGIQIVFNPKGVYKRISLVVSVVLFTVVRTKCKDGGCAKTKSPRGRAKDLWLIEMSEWTSAGKAQGPSTVDTNWSVLRSGEKTKGRSVVCFYARKLRRCRSFRRPDKGSCRPCLCVALRRLASSQQR